MSEDRTDREPPALADFAEAVAHHARGRVADAEALYRRVLDAMPRHVEALNNLAAICGETGRLDEAAALCTRALEAEPDCADVLNTLGIVLRRLGRLEDAVARYRQALVADPAHGGALGNLGLALRALGRHGEAAEALRRAAEFQPNSASARLNLGNALRGAGKPDEAEAAYRDAITLKPGYAQAHCNLGSLLRDLGRLDEAEDELETALEHDPRLVDAHYNLGNAYKERGRYRAAAEAYRAALRVDPDHVSGHWNLSHVLLLEGQFAEGFDEYEWRWRLPIMGSHGFSGPQWDVSAKPGAPVFVHAEQGFGDAIQFVRYVPMIAARGHKVTLCVRPPLHRLFAGLDCADVVTEPSDGSHVGYHCPMLSLPRAFGTRLDTIPNEVPYLRADPHGVARFRSRLSGDDLKVGLVWRGNPEKTGDAQRSLAPDLLKPVLEVEGVRFVSLQKEPVAGDLDGIRRTSRCDDWSAELGDFADTAALIEALDLVISIDTAVAHLAGALAKPVWVLLPFVPDWRWLSAREDSPWYPTACLFRQASPGDWPGAIARLAEALRGFAARARAS